MSENLTCLICQYEFPGSAYRKGRNTICEYCRKDLKVIERRNKITRQKEKLDFINKKGTEGEFKK